MLSLEQTSTQNEAITSPEARSTIFAEARDSLYDLPFNLEFEQHCQSQNIDFGTAPTLDYWEAADTFTKQQVSKEFEANDRHLTPAMVTRELIAATPAHVLAQQVLDHGEAGTSKSEFNAAKSRVIRYNRLIRETAGQLPGLQTDELLGHLYDALNASVKDPELKRIGQQRLREAVSGAQKERVVRDLADYCGFEYETSSAKEDRRGIDLHIMTDFGPLDLDIKSARQQIRAYGGHGDYHIFNDGRVAVVSPVTSAELGTNFDAPDELLEKHADYFYNLINEIASRVHYKNRTAALGRSAMR